MKHFISLDTYEQLCLEHNYGDIRGCDVYTVIDWLMETYTIHVSVIPIKRRGEMQIKYQSRVVDFRDDFRDKEVLFEHQYNGSLPEYTSQKDAYIEAIEHAITLI